MTGTITLTTDATNERIGVTLASWVSPANGALTIYRVHPDTSEWPVRGTGAGGTWATSGGAAFAWDYEAPFGQSVSYYALDGTTKVLSSSTSLVITYPMLRAPGFPANDALFQALAKPALTLSRPGAMLYPLGRTTGIPLSDTRKKPAFTQQIRTKTVSEFTALEAALNGSSTFVLHLPGTVKPWQYVDIGTVTPKPVVDFKAPAGSPTKHVANWYDWELPCTTVAQPVGGIFGDPTASYAAVSSTYATYPIWAAAKPTYLDATKGI